MKIHDAIQPHVAGRWKVSNLMSSKPQLQMASHVWPLAYENTIHYGIAWLAVPARMVVA